MLNFHFNWIRILLDQIIAKHNSFGKHNLLSYSNYSVCTSTISLAVTITTLANQGFDRSTFSYYPNPVLDLLNLSNSQDIVRIKLFNMVGQQLLSKEINASSTQIDMSNYTNGAYFIQVTTGKSMKIICVVKNSTTHVY